MGYSQVRDITGGEAGSYPAKYMKIGHNIEALELTMNINGHQSTIHPVVMWDDDGATLVDTGMVGQYEDLKKALNKAGVKPESIKQIIITHQDIDHIGNLPKFLNEFPQTQVWAHAEDAPYIEGNKEMIKMSSSRLEQMPEEMQTQLKAFMDSLINVKVTKTLEDGEQLDLHGGVEVIFTPGHTPGHISLFVKNEQLLIVGDAMVAEDGQLQGPRPEVTPDLDRGFESIQKFKEHDVEYALCYHGGHLGPNANEQIKLFKA